MSTEDWIGASAESAGSAWDAGSETVASTRLPQRTNSVQPTDAWAPPVVVAIGDVVQPSVRLWLTFKAAPNISYLERRPGATCGGPRPSHSFPRCRHSCPPLGDPKQYHLTDDGVTVAITFEVEAEVETIVAERLAKLVTPTPTPKASKKPAAKKPAKAKQSAKTKTTKRKKTRASK